MKKNEKKFSSRLYEVDFGKERENSYPSCFRLLAMSPHPDKLGVIRSGEFCVTFSGNWHILRSGPLSDFRLGFVLGKNLNASANFLFYLRGDASSLSALYVQAARGRLSFGRLDDTRYMELESVPLAEMTSFDWEILAEGKKITVKNSGKTYTFSAPGTPRKGCIALDVSRYGYGANEFRVRSLFLDVPEETCLPLPSVSAKMKHGPNGIPLGYDIFIDRVKAEKYGLEKWSVTMDGGPGDVEKLHPMLKRFLNAEQMDFPYCRGLDKDGKELFKFFLANGKCGNRNVYRNTFGFPEFPFPLVRNVTVETCDLVFLAFGYEYFQAETAPSCGGGPSEMLCDLSGKRLSFEKVYKEGECECILESCPEKAITLLIPKDIPDYEEALAFAKSNHYFLEGEKIFFRVRCANETATKAILTLEDAFGDPIRKFRRNLDEYFALPELAPGVYHLRAKLYRNKLFLAEKRHAFEVIPDDPEETAQHLSFLPDFFPDGFLSDCSEHFHPWGETVRDVSHYTSTGNMYTCHKDRRYLKLLKVYHRKWTSRCQPLFASEEDNAFIREHACLIQSRDFSDSGRYYLHYPPAYESPFLKEKLKEFAGKVLSFDELYPARWREWLDFIAPFCREKFKKTNTFRPGVKAAEYLVPATYGAIYKGANYPRLMGMDIRNGKYEEILDGFAVVEDYPFSSRYPLSRSIWQFTAFSMEAPKVRFLPQVWGLNAETQDSRVVYSHPPYGISETPAGFFYTRLTELLFDTAWFDGKKFHYWNGYGALHSSQWTRALFDSALAAFKLYRKIPPERPLRTPAYVYSRAACDAHEYFYEKNENFIRGGSMVNTAEEFPAYVYEMARSDGQLGGFQTRMENLKGLTGKDVSCLVLPPLKGVPEKELREIRRLHREGVNLLCSEDASLLADLFDTEHAQVLLEKEGKVFLTLKKNKNAFAAFFTGAPSMQKRARDRTGGSGQKALDPEVNAATVHVMRLLGDYPLTATEGGSLTAFVGKDGASYAFIRENAWPARGHLIRPKLLFHGKEAGDFALQEFESVFVKLPETTGI